MLTYIVLQSFQRGKNGKTVADAPIQYQSKAQALRVAERLAIKKLGVIVFSRSGNPKTGEYTDAEVLYEHGRVPTSESYDNIPY